MPGVQTVDHQLVCWRHYRRDKVHFYKQYVMRDTILATTAVGNK